VWSTKSVALIAGILLSPLVLAAPERRPLVLQVEKPMLQAIADVSPHVADVIWTMTGRGELPAGLSPSSGSAFFAKRLTAQIVRQRIEGISPAMDAMPDDRATVAWIFADGPMPRLTFMTDSSQRADGSGHSDKVVLYLQRTHGLVWRVVDWAPDAHSEYQNARSVAMKYSAALTTGEVRAMVSMLHPSFVASFGGAEKAEELLSSMFPKEQLAGSTWYQEEIGPGSAHVDSDVRLYFFPVDRRVVGADPSLRPMQDTYLVHSADGGKSWSVVSGWCRISEESIRSRLAPNYRGSPPLRQPFAN
jgi:hypothetical protein